MALSQTGDDGTSVLSGEGQPRHRRDRRWWWLAWVWAPVAFWLVLIVVTSGEVGARAQSDIWIWRVLHEWLPALFGLEPSTGTPDFLPAWLRKVAHLTEYAVLGLLTTRAWWLSWGRGAGKVSRLGPAAAAAFCVGVATLDELHQSTLPSRSGSLRDVLIDALGAFAGVAVGVLVWRRLD